MRRYDVPDRATYFQRWSELHLGYDPGRGFWARNWLTLTYHCARPLARIGVDPNLITIAGGLVSGLIPVVAWLGGRWVWLAVVGVVISGLLDNVDGAVAALTDRATALGYVLDSVVDRISDGCYLLALWLLGAPAWLCVLGGVITMLQEYVRARAGSAGSAGLGELAAITVAERPTRVIVTAFAMCGAAVVPASSAGAAAIGAWVWLGLSLVAFAQLTSAVPRHLRAD